MQNTKKAFSLVEILVGLIIISFVLAAFAPTINKKVRAQNAALDNKLTNKCNVAAWNGKCKLCQGTKFCVQCTDDCPVGWKLKVDNCSCSEDPTYNDGE